MKKCLLLVCLALAAFVSEAQINQKALNDFLDDSVIRTGFAGISVYDPAEKKYLLRYNADKNFIPSSNVKLFTLYAGLKYLGDSIETAKILQRHDTLFFQPSGDPSFLHPDFPSQPFLQLLVASKKNAWVTSNARFEKYGNGWIWDDYSEDFMPERFSFPMYGNVFTLKGTGDDMTFYPRAFKNILHNGWPPLAEDINAGYFTLKRAATENYFFPKRAEKKFEKQQVPFIISYPLMQQLLTDTVKYSLAGYFNVIYEPASKWKRFYSRPVDSLFRPMMFNSDNFFAEQTLLMVSNERFGYMSDTDMIDSLLQNDFKEIPNKPRWVDGSGLSRYNLFSPNDFIYILDKTEKEFGIKRLKNILPTAGEGTLKNYYENIRGRIFAKTGSMSNNVSLSGILLTKSNKELIFSVIINNFSGSGRSARRAIEQLILSIYEIN